MIHIRKVEGRSPSETPWAKRRGRRAPARSGLEPPTPTRSLPLSSRLARRGNREDFTFRFDSSFANLRHFGASCQTKWRRMCHLV